MQFFDLFVAARWCCQLIHCFNCLQVPSGIDVELLNLRILAWPENSPPNARERLKPSQFPPSILGVSEPEVNSMVVGCRIAVETFEQRHGLRACMVAPTKIIAGLGMSLGVDCLSVPGATGAFCSSI